MIMEVMELISWAVLDTSGLASRSSTPKRPGSLALATLLPLKLEDSAKQVDTSSQVSTPDDVEMDDPTLEEIHASLPPIKTLGAQQGSSLLRCDLTPRGGQQGPGSLVGNQVLFLSMLIGGNKFQTLGWPFIKMSLRPLRPSRK